MSNVFNYIIRPVTPGDKPILREMLYQAIYVPEGCIPPPENIIDKPELLRYIKDWRVYDDIGFIAMDEKSCLPFGAAWIKLLTKKEPGYGYIDDKTPELTIAVLPGFRNKGAGTMLLTLLLEEADLKYKSVSLSVTPGNPAIKIYLRLGFLITGNSDTSIIMKRTKPGEN